MPPHECAAAPPPASQGARPPEPQPARRRKREPPSRPPRKTAVSTWVQLVGCGPLVPATSSFGGHALSHGPATLGAVDWDDLRFFLQVARHRTLSAAALELGVTQPTAGRRIAALERRLGAKLFTRRPDGFLLSSSGRRILEHAERM